MTPGSKSADAAEERRRRDQKRRAVAPYLKFVRSLDADVDLETRISHIVYDLFEDGVDWLVDALEEGGVTAGFSVPAIHLEREARVRNEVHRFVNAGHEVVVHGYRHTSYMETPYETADEELTDVLSVFEGKLDVRPTGFHVPFMRCSEETATAAAEHGIEWIVGAPHSEMDLGLAFLRPESPYDLQLYERGYSPAEVVERLDAAPEAGSLLLCHPNIHAIQGGTDEFAEWLVGGSFARPSAVAGGEGNRPGLLLDCFPPFEVR